MRPLTASSPNTRAAARALGIHRNTLAQRIRALDLAGIAATYSRSQRQPSHR